jgi:hypothetical protein
MLRDPSAEAVSRLLEDTALVGLAGISGRHDGS